MLSAIARSAGRTLNAPGVHLASVARPSYSLPLILSGQRFYTATASEASEHPDPSSSATTRTTRARKRPENAASAMKISAKAAKDKLKEAEKKAKELAKEKAQKQAVAAKEKEKALREKQAAKAKADKLKEKEKAKAQLALEKQKAKLLASKIKEQTEIATAVSHILSPPKRLPIRSFNLYLHETGVGHTGQGLLLAGRDGWAELDASKKAEFEARAAANKSQHEAAMREFVLAHEPLEIYNHNRAVRLLLSKGVSRRSLNATYKLSPATELKQIEDVRIPKQGPNPFGFFIVDRKFGTDYSGKEMMNKAAQMWKEMSEDEKKPYQQKSLDYENSRKATLIEKFGTAELHKLPFENKSATSVQA